MAKAIKIIKCPSCGSVDKKTIKEDHYQCANCGADYFLDNDDININVNYGESDPNQAKMTTPEDRLIARGFRKDSNSYGMAALGIIVILGLAFFMLWDTKEKSPPSTHIVVGSSTTPKTISSTPPKEEKIEYRETFKSPLLDGCFIYPKDEGIALYRLDDYTKEPKNSLDSSTNNINRTQFTKYDLVNKTRTPIGILIETGNIMPPSWDSYSYENGERYYFKDKKEVWRFDPKTERIENVTKTLLQDFPQYSSGIAEVSFRHNARDGYNSIYIMTNNGKSLHYFPDLNEAYEDNYAFQMLKEGPKRDPSTLKRVDKDTIQTGYTFAHDYEKNYKLIKFQYKTEDGLPRTAEFTSAREDKEGKKNYSLSRILPVNSKWNLLSDKNISEGAFYHEPSIVYFDDDILLIATKRSVASDTSHLLQRIDPNNGEVLWSIPIYKGQYFPLKVTAEKYKDHFIVGYERRKCEGMFMIDAEGNIIDKFDINNFKTIEP